MPAMKIYLAALTCLALGAVAVAQDYTLLGADDRSEADLFRVRLRVQAVDAVDGDLALGIARDLVSRRIRRRAMHVVEVLIHPPGVIDPAAPEAYVVWALAGDPSRPSTREPGDYGGFEYRVELGPGAIEAVATSPLTESAGGQSPRTPAAASTPAPTPTPAAMPNRLPPDTEISLRTAEIMTLLSRWVRAWEAKSLEEYLSYYDSSFVAGARDLEAWADHKQRVFSAAGAIQIEIRDIQVDLDGDRAQVRFVQDYRSETISDLGIKTLALVQRGGDFRILREDWSPR